MDNTWYKEDAFYQIWCRSFKDGNGDGMSGSFFANNYPCLMAGVAMGRTLTFAMKAVKQMAGLE